jgi:DtxR family Mn-dependent transcriptional regulator
LFNCTASEENYIKTIFHLQREEGNVTTNELAARLHTRPASVTDMMKKLKTRKLLHYQPYRGFRLSSEGKKVALGIIRRHRLWEYFLAEKLNFGWDEVHELAEQLEHVRSKKLTDKLDEFLAYPKFDPHGDPIPDGRGRMEGNPLSMLNEQIPNKQLVVFQVLNQSAEMLELLQKRNIHIGTKLEIKRKFNFDNSMEIKIQNHAPFTISEQLAKNLLVKKIK